MSTIKLLPHQNTTMQAPYVFMKERFFFTSAGYGSGKSSGLVYAVMYAVKQLLGKRDKEGHNPRIFLGSKSLTFMQKTLTDMLLQNLMMTNSSFHKDGKNNIITIGNVEILLIPTEDPSQIYGFSCACSFIDELDELNTNIAMEVVRAVNERTRQVISDFRAPFLQFVSSSQGQKGMYQTIMHFKQKGIGYVLMRACTKDNIYLDKSVLDTLYSIYNEDEVRCYLNGEFIAVDSALVFYDFSVARNKLSFDMYDDVTEHDVVYIGQDFNCINGDSLIETLNGKVKMKHLKVGDYVLTRKGYKRVNRKVFKGYKSVEEYNNGLVATPDHIAITPNGEEELWRAKQFYCLKEQPTGYLKKEKEALKILFRLKRLLLTEEDIQETQAGVQQACITSTAVIEDVCIETYINIILEQLRKEIIFTTKMDTMITDLKILNKLLRANTQKNTLLKEMEYMVKKAEYYLNNTMNQKEAEKNIQEFLNRHGKKTNMLVLLFVLLAVKHLKLNQGRYKDVQNVGENGTLLGKEEIIKALKDTVSHVELLLQERLQLLIAKNISIIGKDQTIKERGIQKVYDIEVEDCHEFFANNILVHNCFGNYAAAFVVREGSIIMIKDYKITNISKAPSIFRYDFPTSKIIWIPDMTYKEHFSEFKKELRAFDIQIAYRSSNPLVHDRNFACNKMFFAGRLFITPICKMAERALLTHKIDSKTGKPQKGDDNAPDHINDCMGYVVHYLLSWHPAFKLFYEVTLKRLKLASSHRAIVLDEKEIDD